MTRVSTEPSLLLRVSCAVADKAEAWRVSRVLVAAMSAFGETSVVAPELLGNCFEVLVEVHPKGGVDEVFEGLLPVLGQGWWVRNGEDGGKVATWDRSRGGLGFVEKSVSYASLATQ